MSEPRLGATPRFSPSPSSSSPSVSLKISLHFPPTKTLASTAAAAGGQIRPIRMAAAVMPALMDEIVEEILIRLPPTEPASLLRAALVCKPWWRLVSGPRFRRRLREFHRTPPMLGLICNRVDENFPSDWLTRFVPTCSFRPARADRRDWGVLDVRHGRVLLRGMAWGPRRLVVWDPVMDEWSQLPKGPQLDYDWNAAVLGPACGTGCCDQLDCHRGPFHVVFVGTGAEHMNLWVYSSEAGAWSKPTYLTQIPKYYIDKPPSAVVGNALHFVIDQSRRILKYNLATREISVILQPPESYRKYTAIMTMEDGGLGIARIEKTKLSKWSQEARLSLWSMEASPDGSVVWTQIKVIDLEKLLSIEACSICPDFLGFAHGVGLLYVGTDYGLFSFDLKSGQVRKACEGPCHYDGIRGVLPYMSFYTPALGAVSTGD